MSLIEEVRPFGAPGRPQNVSWSLSSDGVSINWTPPLYHGNSDVHSYNVYRWASDTDPVLIGVVEEGGLELFDTDVKPGAEYRYGVRAVNQNGTGTISEIAFIRIDPKVEPSDVEEEEDEWWTKMSFIVIAVAAILVLGMVIIVLKRSKRYG